VLYRDDDVASLYMTYTDTALLFRAGGYWFDGTTWYRPSQVFDPASERYVNRAVPAALTITAADLLESGGNAARGSVLPIADVNAAAPARSGRWADDLALWAQRRDGAVHPAASIVQLTAPELSAGQLLGVPELAQVADIAASTLRAYLARGENEVPAPQAVVGGRGMWSRPVAEDWAEQRRRSSEGVAASLADGDNHDLPPGVVDLWQWFTRVFTDNLWNKPAIRKRWALRWRTEANVRDVAHDLGWTAAGSLSRIVPMSDLATTTRHALLDELHIGKELFADSDPADIHDYAIGQPVTRMFDWLVRHDPALAGSVVTDVIGEAENRLGIPRRVTEASLTDALTLDGKLGAEAYAKFFDRALPPRDAS
jgi:hypothetical protein